MDWCSLGLRENLWEKKLFMLRWGLLAGLLKFSSRHVNTISSSEAHELCFPFFCCCSWAMCQFLLRIRNIIQLSFNSIRWGLNPVTHFGFIHKSTSETLEELLNPVIYHLLYLISLRQVLSPLNLSSPLPKRSNSKSLRSWFYLKSPEILWILGCPRDKTHYQAAVNSIIQSGQHYKKSQTGLLLAHQLFWHPTLRAHLLISKFTSRSLETESDPISICLDL